MPRDTTRYIAGSMEAIQKLHPGYRYNDVVTSHDGKTIVIEVDDHNILPESAKSQPGIKVMTHVEAIEYVRTKEFLGPKYVAPETPGGAQSKVTPGAK